MPKFVPKPNGKTDKMSEKKPYHSGDILRESKSGKRYIEELDLLDYRGRRNPKVYDDAAQKLEIYVTKLYGWNGYIFMNLKEHEFQELPEIVDDKFSKTNDKYGFVKAAYIEDMKELKKKTSAYNDNKPKVYAIIWGQCTSAMHHKIREDPDFNAFDAAKDPLLLLGRIQEILLTGAGQFQNEIKLKLEAKRDFDRMRQYRNESVGDFYQRYLVEQQALTATGIDLASDEEQAIDFLNKLDVVRFASLLADLENATQAGRDEYPTNVNEAMTRAVNYKIVLNRYNGNENSAVVYATTADSNTKQYSKPKNNYYKQNNKKDQDKKKNTKDGKESTSSKKKTNNTPSEESKKNNDQKRSFHKNIKCYLCGLTGHYKSDCPDLNPEEETNEQANVVFTSLNEKVYFSSKIGPYDVLADNQATVSIFGQKELLKNIRKTDKLITIQGIGGKVSTDLVGDFDFFGEVYYSPLATANVLCFYDLQVKFDITYDKDKNNFNFSLPNGRVITFEEKNKLYVYDAIKNCDHVYVETVKENEMQYTKRQVEDAKNAKVLMQRLGYPSVPDMARMIANGQIIDCPVTLLDIKRAVDIYGPDLATLKGKTVTQKSKIAKIEVLPKFMTADIILCIDLIFINGLTFLISVSEDLGLLMVKFISDRGKSTIQKCLEGMIAAYRSEKCIVRAIKCDGEGGVGALENYILSQGIKFNPTGKNQHVPQIERKARQIKERVRAHISVSPYKMTEKLTIGLVQFCVQSINLIPQSTREVKISPKELFTGRKINFKRDLRLSFGEYAQIHEDYSDVQKNTMKERTCDAIALRMKGNAQGSAEFLNLNTWKVVTRDFWTVLPIPPTVIEKINKKAESEEKTVLSEDFTNSINNEKIDISSEIKDREDISNNQEELNNLLPKQAVRLIPTNEESIVENHDQEINVEEQNNEDETIQNDENLNEQFVQPLNEATDLEEYRGEEMLTQNDKNEVLKDVEEPYNLRSNRAQPGRWKSLYTEELVSMHISVQQSVKDLGSVALKSVAKELRQMVDKNVWKPIYYEELSAEDKKNCIRSRMFIKQKTNGIVKARLVAGGHMQDKSIYENLSSPTVATQSVLMIASIAVSENRKVITADIVGAYLHATMKVRIIMVIDKYLSEILSIMFPYYKQYLTHDSKIYVILLQALYGCVESARLFYLHLKSSLESLGFIKNPYDDCIFNKLVNGVQCSISVHVDDLMITCTSQKILDDTVSSLTKIYKEIKFHYGEIHTYLGMNFIFKSPDYVELNMVKMIEDVIKKYLPEGGTNTSPASNNLFLIDNNSELLNENDKGTFHTITAKLLYLSKRSRPDILTAVAYLTTRVQSPNLADYKKLLRVLKYLNGSKHLTMRLSFDINNNISSWIDASHAVHNDCKSHTGSAISIGSGTVFASSSKQKLNSKSSFESEIIGLTDKLPQVIWTRNWLIAQGYDVKPATIYQDNKSTIRSIKNGSAKNSNTRHINIRYYFATDKIKNKEILIEYLSTNQMIADILTKPLQGKQFTELRKKLMNHE